jgi:cutinase
MAQDATTRLSSCPDTKLILTGYSQGAMVVHNAASKLKAAGKISSVVAAVTFGDPYKTELPAGIATADFHTFCASVSLFDCPLSRLGYSRLSTLELC